MIDKNAAEEARKHVENCPECIGYDRCKEYFRILLEGAKKARQERKITQ